MQPPTDSQHIQHLDAESFRLLVASVHDYAIFMLDTAGHVQSWNAGAERIKGYAAHEIIGSHFSRFYPPEDIAWGKPAWELKEALAVGRFEDEGWRLRKDGTRFWANVVITAVRDRSGRHVGFAKVTRDLTERKRAEEERVELARAGEAVRLRDEFLSLASHELRTPLTPLAMYLQSVERAAARGERVDPEVAAKARRQLRRLSRLIDELLDLSRVQQGRLQLERAPLDIATVVEPVLEDFRASDQRHDFRFERPTQPVWVDADEGRVEQVLLNLVQNAAKYSPEGGPVTVRVTARGGEVWISVSDQGIGIPQEDQTHLFERFFRAGNARAQHFSGLGLGLYLANEIVLRHGGRFELESAQDKGSTFRFCLPRATRQQDQESQGSARLLVVDDDAAIQDAMQSFLRGEGYLVDVASNGDEALQTLRHGRYDMLFVDLMMPGLDGAGLIERLRIEKLAPGTPIVLFSADANMRAKAARLNVDATLRKPIDLDDLTSVVQRLVRRPAPPAR